MDTTQPKRSSKNNVECLADGPSTSSEHGIAKRLNICPRSEYFTYLVRSDVFIDKTLLIKELFMETDGEEPKMGKVLITAPRDFGKSVNMDMVRKFCEIQVDEKGNPRTCVKRTEAGKSMEDEEITPTNNFKLFKNNNLKIYQCHCKTKLTVEKCRNDTCQSRQFFYEHCGQHPVIFLDFFEVLWVCDSHREFVKNLTYVLREAFKDHGYLRDEATSLLSKSKRQKFECYVNLIKCKDLSEEDVLFGLEFLAESLHEHFNRKVIILIDEFDTPIKRLINKSKEIELEYIHSVIEFIAIMVSRVLNGNKHVLGGLLSASSVVGTTLLLYASNIEICPFLENHRFSEYYGFTKDEVDMLLNKPQFKGFDEWEILNYYSGYQVYGSGTKLFCAFSFVHYLHDWDVKRYQHKKVNDHSQNKIQCKPKRYWSERSDMLRLCQLFENEAIRKKFSTIQSHGSISVRNVGYRITPQDVLHLNKLINQPICYYPNNNDVDLSIQYLKDHGFFNVIRENQWWCTLELPIGEVRDEITKRFYNRRFYKKKYNFTEEQISEYGIALSSIDGNHDESFQILAGSIAQLFSGDVQIPKNHDEFKGPLFTFAAYQVRIYSEILFESERRFELGLLIYRKDGTGVIVSVKWGSKNTAHDGLKQIFDFELYKAFEKHNITNQKIYLGLHSNTAGIVTVCALATDKNTIIENWDDVNMQQVIEKCGKYRSHYTDVG
ncbi:uncharacterized protein [Periplaneta americana]|uniref:uncharacterized protein n=1 Tax=Periplaneta americana TaxID=6978 RepID=UPI0037E8403B